MIVHKIRLWAYQTSIGYVAMIYTRCYREITLSNNNN
jgi:hypothetical protein